MVFFSFGAQSCPTLCDSMDCSPQASLSMSMSKNTRVGCHFLLECVCFFVLRIYLVAPDLSYNMWNL